MANDSNVQIADKELTSNLNYLAPTGFRIVIDRVRYPNLQYFCQSVTHPGATLNPVELPTRRVTSVPLAGDKIQFTDVTFTIILDEDMTSYTEMFDWMLRNLNEGQVSQSERLTKVPTYSDITLHVLSSHNNTTKKIRYLDCIPTNLGQISFQSTTGDVTYLTYDATFRFSQFEIV